MFNLQVGWLSSPHIYTQLWLKIINLENIALGVSCSCVPVTLYYEIFQLKSFYMHSLYWDFL